MMTTTERAEKLESIEIALRGLIGVASDCHCYDLASALIAVAKLSGGEKDDWLRRAATEAESIDRNRGEAI